MLYKIRIFGRNYFYFAIVEKLTRTGCLKADTCQIPSFTRGHVGGWAPAVLIPSFFIVDKIDEKLSFDLCL